MVDLFAADATLWMAGAAVAEAVIVAAAAAFAFGQVHEARLLGAGVGRESGLLVVTRDDKRQDHALAVRRFRARPDASLAPQKAAEPALRWQVRRRRQR